eukprot:848-Heterococcus_DN1.PRE.4
MQRASSLLFAISSVYTAYTAVLSIAYVHKRALALQLQFCYTCHPRITACSVERLLISSRTCTAAALQHAQC